MISLQESIFSTPHKVRIMSHIFLSYVEEDGELVQQLARDLEAAGFATWYYQRDSIPGPDYLLQTGEAIEQASAVVLVISAATLNSPHQVTKEVVRAHESGRPFVPILRGIAHAELQARQPSWRQALGAATSVVVPVEGIGTILPRIIAGLKHLCGQAAGVASKSRTCPACQAKLLEGAIACMDCGWMLVEEKPGATTEPPITCPNPQCGLAVPSREPLCPRCRTPLLLQGRYRIEQVLETTGIRSYFRAVDTRTNQPLLVVGVGSERLDTRFEPMLACLKRELELLRLLGRHPLVPRAFDVIQQDSAAFLLKEYFAGEVLLDLLEKNGRRPFALDQVVRWGRSLCEVLERLHRLDPPCVFRALKPAHLLLGSDGQTLKLEGFSVAVGWDDLMIKDRVYTDSYGSPEQICGNPVPASDLFSLANTLYELATGNPPEGTYTGERIAAELQAVPCPYAPAQRWFFELLHTNLSWKPAQRSASARAFEQALGQGHTSGPASPARLAEPSGHTTRPEMITISCSCGARYRVKAEYAGRSATCTKCGNRLVVGTVQG
jgi:serine/threonine-protein kinase